MILRDRIYLRLEENGLVSVAVCGQIMSCKLD